MVTWLSQHFSLDEMISSGVAERHGLDNTPPPSVVSNLMLTALTLEVIRETLGGMPIIVLSGYRSEALNRLVGGVEDSDHIIGCAADIIAPRFGSAVEVAQAIVRELSRRAVTCKQLILEYGRWVHVSVAGAGDPETIGSRCECLSRDQAGYYGGIHGEWRGSRIAVDGVVFKPTKMN